MKFTKMHGIGNDYIYVNGFEETVDDPAALAPIIADRHTGVGGDGLILILPSEVADVRMRMFNADGSESGMCGNGIRCVAKYAHDHGLTDANPVTIETGRGVLTLALDVVDDVVETVTVDMGEPILELEQIPVNFDGSSGDKHLQKTGDHTYQLTMEIGGQPVTATFVSVGNPHAVIYVDDVAAVDLQHVGPKLENYTAFPERINVHFVQIQSRGEIIMRTWERGSGITRACGTGACAVAIAGVLTDRSDRQLLTHLPGGDLMIAWQQETNHVYMSGAAEEVFHGEWEPTAPL